MVMNGLRLSAAIALSLLIPATANSQAVHDVIMQDIVISDTIQNPCNGENIFVDGVIHFRLMILSNPAGGFDVVIHDNNQGIEGLGESGAIYRFVGASDLGLHIPDINAAGQVFNIATSQLLVGQGATPNSHIFEHIHVTVGADGLPIVSHETFEGVCVF